MNVIKLTDSFYSFQESLALLLSVYTNSLKPSGSSQMIALGICPIALIMDVLHHIRQDASQ